MRRTKKDCAVTPGREGRRRIEQHDEVDIARIIQLARAVFSHREHDEAAILQIEKLIRRMRFRQQKIGNGDERACPRAASSHR